MESFINICNQATEQTSSYISVQMIAILATFLASILGIFVSLSTSRKARHNNIASTRRKERIDNFIIFYSKISALIYPDTIKSYVLNSDFSFCEKLINNYSNLNMLFDHRYERDIEFTDLIEKIVEDAISYYSIEKTNKFSEVLSSEYKKKYSENIKKTDKLLNIYVGTEWERLNKEVLNGEPINFKKWKKIYKKSEDYFEKWNNINPPAFKDT